MRAQSNFGAGKGSLYFQSSTGLSFLTLLVCPTFEDRDVLMVDSNLWSIAGCIFAVLLLLLIISFLCSRVIRFLSAVIARLPRRVLAAVAVGFVAWSFYPGRSDHLMFSFCDDFWINFSVRCSIPPQLATMNYF